MKVILYDRIRSIPGEENVEERDCCIQEFEEEFFEFCQQEVEKINSFFEGRLDKDFLNNILYINRSKY